MVTGIVSAKAVWTEKVGRKWRESEDISEMPITVFPGVYYVSFRRKEEYNSKYVLSAQATYLGMGTNNLGVTRLRA